MQNPTDLPPELLSALRTAAGQELPLFSKGGKNPVPGLFPGGAKGKDLLSLAVDKGLLRTDKRRPPGSKSAVEYGIITAEGLGLIARIDSPRAALEALLPAVQSISKPLTPPDMEAVQSIVRSATQDISRAIETGFARIQSSIDQIARPHGGAGIDPGVVLSSLQAALERVPSMPAAATPVPPPPVEPPVAEGGQLAIEEEILEFVTRHAQETSVGCSLDVLMRHLRKADEKVTIGDFHNVLRKLHQDRRIQLGGWPRMLDDLPEPELALFVSSKVMYYAQPYHR